MDQATYYHSQCNSSFCKFAAAVTEKSELRVVGGNDENIDRPLCPVQLTVLLKKEEVHMHNEDEEAREGDNTIDHTAIPKDLLFQESRADDRLVSMAPQLISNATSNLAECFMNIRCKFDGGKFFNRVQGGSFQHRTYGAGLRFQLGPDWSSKVWPKATGSEAGEIAKTIGKKRVIEHNQSIELKSTEKYQKQRKQAK